MESVNVDEIIINFVRDNQCLYDKRNADFRNVNQKKDLWKIISKTLQDVYKVNMSADGIERRWSSLRDMFSREIRRRKLSMPDSRSDTKKEWEFYKNMLFLTPYITHRRPKRQEIWSQGSSFKKSLQSSNLISSSSYGQNGLSQTLEENIPNEDEKTSRTIDSEITGRAASSLSSCSSIMITESSESSTSVSPTFFNPASQHDRKTSPTDNKFTKSEKSTRDRLEHSLVKVHMAILTAMKTISRNNSKSCNNGYISAIEEAFKHVPSNRQLQVLLEILQVIQKYTEKE